MTDVTVTEELQSLVVRVVPSPEVVTECAVTPEWMPPQWEILEGGR